MAYHIFGVIEGYKRPISLAKTRSLISRRWVKQSLTICSTACSDKPKNKWKFSIIGPLWGNPPVTHKCSAICKVFPCCDVSIRPMLTITTCQRRVCIEAISRYILMIPCIMCGELAIHTERKRLYIFIEIMFYVFQCNCMHHSYRASSS